MAIGELPIFARSILKDLLPKHGEVLYSSHETIKKGDIYLLGLNPGGHGFITIEQHIEQMLTRETNAFIDDEFNNYRAGKAPLQKRVSFLLKELGYETRDVCASNLIFQTTVNAEQLCFGLAGLCWPFHEKILSIVQPKLLLVFGNGETVSPYAFIKALYGGDETIQRQNNHVWKCLGTRICGRDTLVAGISHLSRFDPMGNPELIGWLKSKLDVIPTTLAA